MDDMNQTQPTVVTASPSYSLWKVLGGLAALVLIVAAGAGAYLWQQQTIDARDAHIHSLNTSLEQAQSDLDAAKAAGHYVSSKGAVVIVYAPTSGATVTNPAAVIGQVPGTWSSEAAFPVELQDNKEAVVARGTAHVLGDWMTGNLVPFSASIVFTGTPHGNGTLVLHKDNPSGLPKNDDEVRVPIQF